MACNVTKGTHTTRLSRIIASDLDQEATVTAETRINGRPLPKN